ncbi:MAG: DUF6056 family protein [Fibromonadales bacterium]|nr:DUF6056 family protein [Fibromonadales bacterium]
MKKIAGILSLAVVIAFFILNVLTPLIADDYGYSLANSAFDAVKLAHDRYLDWDGRLFGHFWTYFWLFTGKSIFNIANTIMYCLFVFLVQFHIIGKMKYSPVLFLAINIFLWFFMPAWGQNFLWLSGSSVYLWTTVFILLFLIPFRKKYDDNNYNLNILLSILFLFLGIIAGCSSENAAAATLLLLIAYFAEKIVNKKNFSLFEFFGMAGFLIGFLLLILAPGNEVRQGLLQHYGSEQFMILKRIVGVTLVFGKDLGFALIAACAILAFDLIYNKKHKLNMFSAFYVLAAVTGAYSMLLSPSFPPRSFFIVIVFAGIALGNILLQMEIKLPEIIKRNSIAIAVCCLIGFSFSFLNSSRNIIGVYMEWNKRAKYIEEEKAKGNFDIEVRSPIPVWDKHVAQYNLQDIKHNKDEWPNISIAEYFGLSSIKKSDSDNWEVMWFK